MDPITCIYFDGIDSTAHSATLAFANGQLHVTGDWGSTAFAVTDVKISDRLGNAPRTIFLPAAAACELPGGAATNAFLAQFAPKESAWFRAQFDWRWVAGSAAGLIVLALAGYRWGIPLASEFIAYRLPDAVAEQISKVALAEVDRMILDPSKLPEARRKLLAEKFALMRTPSGDAITHRVEFRDAEKFVGPNAFALPSGTIVMTDQLVNLMQNDEQILGVLAHELGHVNHKHGMKNMIQASFVGAAVAYWIGDFSAVLAGGATTVLQTKFSREYETQADDFGAAMMRANGMAPEALASALALLESDGASRKKDDAGAAKRASKKSRAKDGDWSDYISSHPNTTQRIERLRSR